MKKEKAQDIGIEAVVSAIQRRHPDLNRTTAEIAAGRLVELVAKGLQDGENIALVRRTPDNRINEMCILELVEDKDIPKPHL